MNQSNEKRWNLAAAMPMEPIVRIVTLILEESEYQYTMGGMKDELFRGTDTEGWHCKGRKCSEGGQLFESSDGY